MKCVEPDSKRVFAVIVIQALVIIVLILPVKKLTSQRLPNLLMFVAINQNQELNPDRLIIITGVFSAFPLALPLSWCYKFKIRKTKTKAVHFPLW